MSAVGTPWARGCLFNTAKRRETSARVTAIGHTGGQLFDACAFYDLQRLARQYSLAVCWTWYQKGVGISGQYARVGPRRQFSLAVCWTGNDCRRSPEHEQVGPRSAKPVAPGAFAGQVWPASADGNESCETASSLLRGLA